MLDGTVDSLYKELGNTDYAFYHGTMKLATKKLKRIIMDLKFATSFVAA